MRSATCVLACLCFCILGVHSTASTFWVITDTHMDPDYSPGAPFENLCHWFVPTLFGDNLGGEAPLHGSFNCEAPMSMLLSAIEHMRAVEPNPSFIMWLGDTVPHEMWNPPQNSESKILMLIKLMTDLLKIYFPHTPVFPVLGNHDVYPQDQLPDHSCSIYRNCSLMWSRLGWLGPGALASFADSGFYVQSTPNQRVTFVGLNTVMYMRTNKQPSGASQIEWLSETLKIARAAGQKVLLGSHVPVGVDGELNATRQAELIQVLESYSDVILASFFGHNHQDSFCLMGSHSQGLGVGFLHAPVTPFGLAKWNMEPVNPGIRLYSLDSEMQLSYTQHILDFDPDLDPAHASASDAYRWAVEYSLPHGPHGYDMADLSPASYASLIDRLVASPALFELFYKHMRQSVGMQGVCDGECRRKVIDKLRVKT